MPSISLIVSLKVNSAIPRNEDIDTANGLGWTALHIAASIGDLRLINLLLDAGK